MSYDPSTECTSYLRAHQSEIKLKSSHARHLIAAFFGYKSHEALLSDPDFPSNIVENFHDFSLNADLMDIRRSKLSGLPEDLPTSELIAQELQIFMSAYIQIHDGDEYSLIDENLDYFRKLLPVLLRSNIKGKFGIIISSPNDTAGQEIRNQVVNGGIHSIPFACIEMNKFSAHAIAAYLNASNFNTFCDDFDNAYSYDEWLETGESYHVITNIERSLHDENKFTAEDLWGNSFELDETSVTPALKIKL